MWDSGAWVQPGLEGAALAGLPGCECRVFLERRVEGLSLWGRGAEGP